MSRPLFMFRPNLQNEEHRRAWEILQAVPEGQKNAFLVQVILENAHWAVSLMACGMAAMLSFILSGER